MEMEIDSIDLPSTTGIDIRAKSPTKSDSGKSDSSSLSYTDEFETLPSSGPTSHAHILDLGEYAATMKEEGALKLQDAVVTTLFNISPNTLKTFVNPTVHTFKAIFGSKNVQLVIWRKGLEVWAGKFECHGGVAKMTIEIEEKEMAKRASALATAVIGGRYWERKTDVKMT
jgi:hypothetical protein